MSEIPSSSPSRYFLARRLVELLTGFAVLLVLQTGLVPFDFATPEGQTGSNDLFGVRLSALTSADLISNVFLYLPVGALLFWTLRRALRSTVTAALLAMVLSAVLSGTVEWLQSFSPVRVSSMVDLVSNVFGAGLGVSLAVVAAWSVPHLIDDVLNALRQRPLTVGTKAYVCVLVMFAVMPFSFSLDPGLLKRSIKQVQVVPFASFESNWQQAEAARAAGDPAAYAEARWQAMRCWSRWSAEVASFAVLSWLVLSLFLTDYGFHRISATTLTWWLCGGLAIGLSLLQIPVVTRGVDATDVLFRGVGMLAGSLARLGWKSDARGRDRVASGRLVRRAAAVGCVLVLLYLVMTGMMPFVFEVAIAGPARALTSTSFLPFHGYFATRFDVMMADLMEKFAAYVLFAAMLITARPALRDAGGLKGMFKVVCLGVTVATLIEFVQMFVPTRVAGLTDLIIAACGCATGVMVQEHVVKFRSVARSLATDASETTPPLSPTDELLAQLTDAHPDSPVEEVPDQRVSRRG